jgi:hypothetical protein
VLFRSYAREPHIIGILFDAFAKKPAITKSELDDIERSTDSALCYVTENDVGFRSTTVILIGRFSSWSIDTGLTCSGQWTKLPGARAVWKHKSFPVYFSNPHGYMIVMTDGEIDPILGRIDSDTPGSAVSARALPVIESAACALYVPHPGEGGFENAIPFNKEKVPLEEILVTVSGTAAGNDMLGRFFLSKPPESRIFITSLKTFVVWLARKSGIENFTKRITVEDADCGAEIRFLGCTNEELGKIAAMAFDQQKE